MQCGVHHFVCGAAGSGHGSWYGGEDLDRKMDWYDVRYASVPLLSHKSQVALGL